MHLKTKKWKYTTREKSLNQAGESQRKSEEVIYKTTRWGLQVFNSQ